MNTIRKRETKGPHSLQIWPETGLRRTTMDWLFWLLAAVVIWLLFARG